MGITCIDGPLISEEVCPSIPKPCNVSINELRCGSIAFRRPNVDFLRRLMLSSSPSCITRLTLPKTRKVPSITSFNVGSAKYCCSAVITIPVSPIFAVRSCDCPVLRASNMELTCGGTWVSLLLREGFDLFFGSIAATSGMRPEKLSRADKNGFRLRVASNSTKSPILTLSRPPVVENSLTMLLSCNSLRRRAKRDAGVWTNSAEALSL